MSAKLNFTQRRELEYILGYLDDEEELREILSDLIVDRDLYYYRAERLAVQNVTE